jgi:ABC-type Fe3+/spermidine/putrescine transport system ATPase subunit
VLWIGGSRAGTIVGDSQTATLYLWQTFMGISLEGVFAMSLLSGGRFQQVSLAGALTYDPSTLLPDEPFTSLGAKVRKRPAADLKNIQREFRITTFFVTHEQDGFMFRNL